MNQHLNGWADYNKVSQFEASKVNAMWRSRRRENKSNALSAWMLQTKKKCFLIKPYGRRNGNELKKYNSSFNRKILSPCLSFDFNGESF